MTSHVGDGETLGYIHTQVVGPGQGRHKLRDIIKLYTFKGTSKLIICSISNLLI
jgi:hypothetical protein